MSALPGKGLFLLIATQLPSPVSFKTVTKHLLGIFSRGFASHCIVANVQVMYHRLLWLCCFVFGSLPAVAATSHVKADLVSDVASVQPGKPFTVALHLVHDAHWHTYWVNPGTGLATSLTWKLPPGWTAGPIQWPTPVVLVDRTGSIVGNGYDGDLLLPVKITPAANASVGTTVDLQAKADWLMCSDVCMPGGANVDLKLPIASDAPPANEPWHSRLAQVPEPQATTGWQVTATRDGKNIILVVAPPQGTTLHDPHFFGEDGYIQYDQPQTAVSENSGYKLTLPISDSPDAKTTRLVGVISSQNPFAGYRIDVPIAEQNGAVANAASANGSANGASQTSASAATGGRTFFGVLTIALVGGMILNLMPCVFPVLGIKILGFVNQSGADRAKVTLHGLTFTAGVVLSFWTLAGLLTILRASGAQLGWGFQLQSAPFVFALAVVMLVFALSMSGVFEFGLGATGFGAQLQSKTGFAGSFFTGVLATVVATPCSAPFLAPALGAALALAPVQSFAVFTAIAVGLSLPYLLLSIFPSAVKLLPRPGAWMETFKQVMAFPLYATVAYLIWVLAGQASENGFLMALFGLTLIAMAAWLYGRFGLQLTKPKVARFGLVGGLLLFIAGAALGWPKNPSPDDIVWQAWSPEAVAKARSEGHIVYVDFTARWCATCQANKKLVFSASSIKDLFKKKNVTTLEADWTNRDARITAELAKWNRSAVPFNLVYKPGHDAPEVLPELLTPNVVQQAVQ